MKIVVLVVLAMLFSESAFAVEIASCSNPKGKAYYPYLGIMEKNKSGWQDDSINDGITQLTKNDKGEYDILFIDSTKTIISSKADGGQVIMLNKGEDEFSFFVYYPGQTVEVFTFLTNKDGENEYIHVTIRGGDTALATKSSIFRGDCSYIHHDLVQLRNSGDTIQNSQR